MAHRLCLACPALVFILWRTLWRIPFSPLSVLVAATISALVFTLWSCLSVGRVFLFPQTSLPFLHWNSPFREPFQSTECSCQHVALVFTDSDKSANTGEPAFSLAKLSRDHLGAFLPQGKGLKNGTPHSYQAFSLIPGFPFRICLAMQVSNCRGREA